MTTTERIDQAKDIRESLENMDTQEISSIITIARFLAEHDEKGDKTMTEKLTDCEHLEKCQKEYGKNLGWACRNCTLKNPDEFKKFSGVEKRIARIELSVAGIENYLQKIMLIEALGSNHQPIKEWANQYLNLWSQQVFKPISFQGPSGGQQETTDA